MGMKQLSVFIENREGRLENVSQFLSENGINVISVSLADTSEYGMLRLIVSDPDKGKSVLKDNGFKVSLTQVQIPAAQLFTVTLGKSFNLLKLHFINSQNNKLTSLGLP